MSFNYSHYPDNSYRSSENNAQLISQKDIIQDEQPYQLLITNDMPSDILIFDEENPSKATINFTENETHSSIIASNSFDFDQYLDENLQIFYQLEQLNKSCCDIIQTSSLNNNNKYLQNSEYISNDPNFNDTKQSDFIDFFEQNYDLIPTSMRQTNSENNFNEQDGYRKQYKYYRKDFSDPQLNDFEQKEIVSHNYNNQQNKIQTDCKPQLNNVNININEIQKNNKFEIIQQNRDNSIQQRCGFIELDNKQKFFYQPSNNHTGSQKMDNHQNIFLNSNKMSFQENQFEQFIIKENQSRKYAENINSNEFDMNQNSFTNRNNNNYIMPIQFKQNKQIEYVEQDFQNNFYKEVPSNFNYYEYYKINQDKQKSGLSQDNYEIYQPIDNQNNLCQYQQLFDTQVNQESFQINKDADQNQIVQKNIQCHGKIQMNNQKSQHATNVINFFFKLIFLFRSVNMQIQISWNFNKNTSINYYQKQRTYILKYQLDKILKIEVYKLKFIMIKQDISSSNNKQQKKTNNNMETNDLSKHKNQKKLIEDQLEKDDNEISQINSKNKKSYFCSKNSTSTFNTFDEEAVTKKDEEILQKIEEMKICNKKNVVKNIMNAFKNFILETELKNTLKINSNIVALYNNSKTEDSDNLQQIIKKFKRYINAKNFNHYTLRLLILHLNYGPVFQYYLQGPFYEWANTCKANDLPSHFVMVDFLLLSFKDIKYIDELKRHDKKKAHYQ